MKIQVQIECSDCKTTGIVQNPIWEDFWKENPEGLNDEKTQQWFSDHGYDREYWNCHEEIQCNECEGHGYRYKWMPVSEVLSAVANVV